MSKEKVIHLNADVLSYAFREGKILFLIEYLKLRIQDSERKSGNIPSCVAQTYLGYSNEKFKNKILKNPFLNIHHGVVSPKSQVKILKEFDVEISVGKNASIKEEFFELLTTREGLFSIFMSFFTTISRFSLEKLTGYCRMQQIRLEKSAAVVTKKYNYTTFNPVFEDAVQIGTSASGEPIRQVSNTYQTPFETSKVPLKRLGLALSFRGEVENEQGKRSAYESCSDKLPVFYGKNFGKSKDIKPEYFDEKLVKEQGRFVNSVQSGIGFDEIERESRVKSIHRVFNSYQRVGVTYYVNQREDK